MRVAVVTTSYPLRPGQAAGHFVAAEARALCEQGHEVTVVAPGPSASQQGHSPALVRIAGRGLFGPPGVAARFRENPLRALGALEFVLGARRVLSRRGPFDLIIAHWLIPCAWPIGVGLAERVEAVAHGSDVRLLGALPRFVRDHVASTLLRHDVALRCVSESLREELISATREELRALTRVQPAALELRLGPPADQVRRKLGLAAEEQLAVVVARLVPQKRVRVALLGVARLPGVRVVVIGGGPLLEPLRLEFPEVRFAGELTHPETLSWIAAADVLINASLVEGAPTSVREARALGVPTVACPAGDLAPASRHDTGLWLVPERSAGPAER